MLASPLTLTSCNVFAENYILMHVTSFRVWQNVCTKKINRNILRSFLTCWTSYSCTEKYLHCLASTPLLLQFCSISKADPSIDKSIAWAKCSVFPTAVSRPQGCDGHKNSRNVCPAADAPAFSGRPCSKVFECVFTWVCFFVVRSSNSK